MKKSYLSMLFSSLLLSSVAFGLVATRMAPYDETGWFALILFFISGFTVLSSLFALLGIGTRLLLWKDQTHFFHVLLSLRQGIILSLVCLGALGFEILNVLTWWNMALLFGAGLLVELYFLNRMHIS